jgi:hypothetical protein
MGVVIEICTKHPGVRTRMRATDIARRPQYRILNTGKRFYNRAGHLHLCTMFRILIPVQESSTYSYHSVMVETSSS